MLKEIVQEYLFILITERKEAQQISLEYFSKLDKIKLWLKSVQNIRCFLPIGDIYNIFGCSSLELSFYVWGIPHHLSLSERQGLPLTLDTKKQPVSHFFCRPKFGQSDALAPEFDPKQCKSGKSILVCHIQFPKAVGAGQHLTRSVSEGGSCRVCSSLAATMTFPDKFWDPRYIASFHPGPLAFPPDMCSVLSFSV